MEALAHAAIDQDLRVALLTLEDATRYPAYGSIAERSCIAFAADATRRLLVGDSRCPPHDASRLGRTGIQIPKRLDTLAAT